MSENRKSIFLCHNNADKLFARRLAKDLNMTGAKVWLDIMEINVGDSLIGKIEAGLGDTDYLGAVLSPDSVKSNWVRTELRAVLTEEIADGQTRVLPILYRDCTIPLFLRDKLYADFLNQSYRQGLRQILLAMGVPYDQRWSIRDHDAFDPISEASDKILSIGDTQLQSTYVTALYVSMFMPFLLNERNVAIPFFIENRFDITLEQQFKNRITLTHADADRYVKGFGRKIKAFMRLGAGLRYKQVFKRDPATVWSGPDHYMFSYGELLEWFEIPHKLEFPHDLERLVNRDLLPRGSDLLPKPLMMTK